MTDAQIEVLIKAFRSVTMNSDTQRQAVSDMLAQIILSKVSKDSTEIPKAETYVVPVTMAGNVIIYLTDTGTLAGNAVFASVTAVMPFVNDSTRSYTYGWSVSPDLKTLTVNTKVSPAIGMLLGVPTNVAIGTTVNVTVVGTFIPSA